LKNVEMFDMLREKGELERKIRKMQKELEKEKAKVAKGGSGGGALSPPPVSPPPVPPPGGLGKGCGGAAVCGVGSESDDSEDGELRVLVGIELVRETQDEVVALQVHDTY